MLIINKKLENGVHMTSDTFLIPNECIEPIKYIYLMYISYIFWCFCTIISDSTYAISLKTSYCYDIVIYGFNSVAYM